MLPSTQQIRFCASRDGTRIAYGICGNGPPLVWVAHFVHHLNFDWDSPVWRPWISALAERHTLIRYDFRGTGLSDRSGVEFTFEKLVEDFEAVVNASGVRNFALLAMSGGARIVLPFAVQNPDRVSRLVLYGTSPAGPLTAKAPPERVENMQVQLKAFELGWPQDIPGFGTFLTSLHIPDATAEQARSFNELLRLTTSAANAVALLRTLVESDMQDLLPNLRCPTLVFHSRQSAVLPFDDGRRVAALVPDARFVPLESRNHILLGTEPAWKQFVYELDEFLPCTSHDGATESFDELTARERDVVELLAHGMSNGDISVRLKISAKTVRNHVSAVLGKLGANSRAQAVAVARDAGFGRRMMARTGSRQRSD
ncbi:pimeloyl-ACP methyl ester carboxylesterase/DNA-binding CsgD family transcriptional regulator [Bradyrhizobium sp. S3.3.6]|uniref:alpha/beta fold hydrolase n=1 Tax=Bradyrhizobium sp. S3.3.6 TaxID=3156429 RepID=UPI003392974C